MRHQVVCGEYKLVLDTPTPRQAALDAMFLWTCKASKPSLSTFIGITNKRKTVYITTQAILQEISDGEVQNNGGQKTDRLSLD